MQRADHHRIVRTLVRAAVLTTTLVTCFLSWAWDANFASVLSDVNRSIATRSRIVVKSTSFSADSETPTKLATTFPNHRVDNVQECQECTAAGPFKNSAEVTYSCRNCAAKEYIHMTLDEIEDQRRGLIRETFAKRICNRTATLLENEFKADLLTQFYICQWTTDFDRLALPPSEVDTPYFTSLICFILATALASFTLIRKFITSPEGDEEATLFTDTVATIRSFTAITSEITTSMEIVPIEPPDEIPAPAPSSEGVRHRTTAVTGQALLTPEALAQLSRFLEKQPKQPRAP